jgi:hypothetical protein
MPGSYVFSGYASTDDPARVYPIRVQPETIALVINGISNDAPSGGTTEQVSARVSGRRRTYGCNARTVAVQFTGTPPSGYKPGQTIHLPILKPDVFADIVKNQTGSYLSAAIRVIGKKPEYIN